MVHVTKDAIDADTANAYAYITVGGEDVRTYTMLISNTGGTNGLSWKVEADMDQAFGTAQELKAEATLAHSTSTNTTIVDSPWRFVRVGYKSQTADSHTTCSIWIHGV